MGKRITYKMQPWMMWQKHDNIFYLCDLRDESLYLMRDVAYEIINAVFVKGNAIEETIEKLAIKYDIEENTVRLDADEFLTGLINADIVKKVERYDGD